MSATKARSERNTWTERVTADRSATQHRGRQARGIKARKKTQRTDTESLGLQHESRRGSSGARLGTRGTWISSLPSGVGSYANEKKNQKTTADADAPSVARRARRQKKKIIKKMCQRDRSTESTNEDIVGLCLARESLRRRDERGHQRSARAFEVVWASSSSRLGLGLRAKKETRCVWGRRLTVSRAKARPAAPTKYPYVRRARRRAMPRRPRDARQRGRIGASRGLEEARAEPVQVHERDGRG